MNLVSVTPVTARFEKMSLTQGKVSRDCGRLPCHRGAAGESGAAPLVESWRGEGTARRLKLAMLAGLDLGRTWRVPRNSVAAGVTSRSRKTRTPGWTSLAERRLKPPVCHRRSICEPVAEARATLGRASASAG